MDQVLLTMNKLRTTISKYDTELDHTLTKYASNNLEFIFEQLLNAAKKLKILLPRTLKCYEDFLDPEIRNEVYKMCEKLIYDNEAHLPVNVKEFITNQLSNIDLTEVVSSYEDGRSSFAEKIVNVTPTSRFDQFDEIGFEGFLRECQSSRLGVESKSEDGMIVFDKCVDLKGIVSSLKNIRKVLYFDFLVGS